MKSFDFGLSFALSNLRLIFLFSIAPALLQLVSEYLHFNWALPREQVFLLFILSATANAWLLLVMVMAAAVVSQGRMLQPFFLFFSAWRYLAKTLLSYLLLIAIIMFFVFAPPLLPLVLFFVWAPFFSAGELFVPHSEEQGDDDDEPFLFGGGEDEDDEHLGSEEDAALEFFANKSVWDLGVIRSFYLSTEHLRITVFIVLMIWLGNVLPPLIVDIFPFSSTSFAPKALYVFLGTFADAFVCACAAWSFFGLLPKEGLEELEMTADSRKKAEAALNHRCTAISFEKLRILTVVLAIVASLLTYHFLQKIQEAQLFPPSVKAQVLSSDLKDGRFSVSLMLNDEDDRFRWLDQKRFRLKFKGASQDVQTNPDNLKAESEDSQKTPQYYEVREAVPYHNGEVIKEDNFVPFYGPLELRLYFSVAENELSMGEFELYYLVPNTEATLVLTGKYGGV